VVGRDADRVVGAAGEPVRAFFDSYLAQDRAAAERLAAEDFVFTSPQDDHIDRATFFERCFPTADRFKDNQLLVVVPTEVDDVFVLYEYELEGGQRYRNTEVITVQDGRLTEARSSSAVACSQDGRAAALPRQAPHRWLGGPGSALRTPSPTTFPASPPAHS
jgi:ketosteroid isomerase-like protein